jgi:hypothetical protein
MKFLSWVKPFRISVPNVASKHNLHQLQKLFYWLSTCSLILENSKFKERSVLFLFADVHFLHFGELKSDFCASLHFSIGSIYKEIPDVCVSVAI